MSPKTLKKILYFTIAGYFRFFASIKLLNWKPRIIVITGSNAKTTTLHLIEAQLGKSARYSHRANSAFGVAFDILGLSRRTLLRGEWVFLFLTAPLKTFSNIPTEKIYVVEADCDRPKEGKFLATLLKPEVTIWLSSSRTHSENFDFLVIRRKFESVEKAIAYEFGWFLEYTSALAITNGDDPLILEQLNRTKVHVKKINRGVLQYRVNKDRTYFRANGKEYSLNVLLPEVAFYSLAAVEEFISYIKGKFDPTFPNLTLPPGRSSVLVGIRETTLVDSTYNSSLASMGIVIDMFNKLEGKKWVVLGDLIELGEEESEEHTILAEKIAGCDFEKIILAGPRIVEYTYPKLKSLGIHNIVTFSKTLEVLDYLKQNLKGKEVLLFKGAGFLEGVVEGLLQNKSDAQKLCRREKIWQIRRKQWGF